MKPVKSIVVAAIAIAAGGSVAAVAEDKGERTVEQFTCRDIMRESGSHRDTSIAFLHGYLLAKSDASSFNLGTLTKQTDAFIEHCLDNPGEKAVEAMATVQK